MGGWVGGWSGMYFHWRLLRIHSAYGELGEEAPKRKEKQVERGRYERWRDSFNITPICAKQIRRI